MFIASILKIIFWSVVVFGFFITLRTLCGYYLLKQNSFIKSDMVLFVGNDEETIENTVRIAAEEIFFTARDNLLNTLTIVDMGSTDSTIDILKILKREYLFLRILSIHEYIDEIREKKLLQ